MPNFILALFIAMIAARVGAADQEYERQRRFRTLAIQEAIQSMDDGKVSLMNVTKHPMFEWFVNKIEFTLNLEAAIKEWEGVDAPQLPVAPRNKTATPTSVSRRRLLSHTNCRKPGRGLKATKQTKCRKIKDRAYFGKLIKQVRRVLDPNRCCSLCGRTAGCVAWTVKPRTAGKERGCFLRRAGKKTKKLIRGYWSGYILTEKSPAPVPVASPPEEAYEAPAYFPDASEAAIPPDANAPEGNPPEANPPEANLPPGTAKYKEVLDLHWKFYEAQRSGPEPSWNRIPWRGSSHVDDVVVGGIYDAGDFLKLNFPLASTMIHTGHGLVDFRSGCSSSRTSALRMYKWGIKYLLDCLDVDKGTYIAQIGDPKIDHNYWGRAEEQRVRRPAYVYKKDSMPASDLYGSVSAALAQASVVFEMEGDPIFAQDCLDGALELFKWGDGRPGKYSNYYKDQTKIYKSTGGDDSMATAAGWIYRKTGDPVWLEKARSYFDYKKADVYCGWDSLWGSHVAHMISLADRGTQVPGIEEYRRWSNNKYWRAWLDADGFQSIVKTPKGLHYPKWNAWANLAFSTTSASHALIQAKFTNDMQLKTRLMNYARGQANYAIGGNGIRSYVIGWGSNWPKFAHHAGASCPTTGPCGKSAFKSREPNPNGPDGAMVAGPGGVRKDPDDPDGAYNDRRDDYVTNEVALDYNAGLNTLLCGLVELF